MVIIEQIMLSERLRKSCAAKGIDDPRWVIPCNGAVYHCKIYDHVSGFGLDSVLIRDSPEPGLMEPMKFITPTIAEGKRYWMRDMSVTGPLVLDTKHRGCVFADSHSNQFFWGLYGNFQGCDCATIKDIIAEYVCDSTTETTHP